MTLHCKTIETLKAKHSCIKKYTMLLCNAEKVYTITDHSMCFSPIPVESNNVVCVRESQHALARLFQTTAAARIVSRLQSITS